MPHPAACQRRACDIVSSIWVGLLSFQRVFEHIRVGDFPFAQSQKLRQDFGTGAKRPVPPIIDRGAVNFERPAQRVDSESAHPFDKNVLRFHSFFSFHEFLMKQRLTNLTEEFIHGYTL